jgi:hypothetical protein
MNQNEQVPSCGADALSLKNPIRNDRVLNRLRRIDRAIPWPIARVHHSRGKTVNRAMDPSGCRNTVTPRELLESIGH